jgi:hypothetical protein
MPTNKLTISVICVLVLVTTFVHAQQSKTILGDAWRGVVESTNEATREITIVNPDKKTEKFVGVLKDGYQVTMKDGTSRELKMLELKPGLNVRVFYKSKTIEVAGRDTKVKLIHRIDFLGRDDYTRLREHLKVQPSIPVDLVEKNDLPTTNPLKIYMSLEPQLLGTMLDPWMHKWTHEQSAKYGKVAFVEDLAQADVSLVVIWGSDDPVALVPLPIDISGVDVRITPATVYLTSQDEKGVHVLLERRMMIDANHPQGSAPSLAKELEKRLKARAK